MKYEDIFEKPITEYTDEEITARAMQLRLTSKVSKKLTDTDHPTTKPKPVKQPATSKTAQMLEAALAKAKSVQRAEGNQDGSA